MLVRKQISIYKVTFKVYLRGAGGTPLKPETVTAFFDAIDFNTLVVKLKDFTTSDARSLTDKGKIIDYELESISHVENFKYFA